MAGWQDPVKGTTCGCMKFLRIERPGRWVAIRQIPASEGGMSSFEPELQASLGRVCNCGVAPPTHTH